jgi:hypothetical protein
VENVFKIIKKRYYNLFKFHQYFLVYSKTSLPNYDFVELIIRPIGGGLAPSSLTLGSLLITPVAAKAGWENQPSTAPMDLTNSQFDEPLYYNLM